MVGWKACLSHGYVTAWARQSVWRAFGRTSPLIPGVGNPQQDTGKSATDVAGEWLPPPGGRQAPQRCPRPAARGPLSSWPSNPDLHGDVLQGDELRSGE